ncbi:IucA/IucC family siderophore biosynthesis protein [Streptomyces oryzae]|uniref:IucA/IucC family siderophore biosynthesis protein n=1 Tax=Streptomyces oryzae TaxID=1434886 RepID=A0ABS3XM55_9ACTN|nr:IucA/IucC family protein [Streptomyces oryzae]MBO8196498.1 IucA/IucC family siderophore biosynthesis protein [Streptomyces oryzae]
MTTTDTPAPPATACADQLALRVLDALLREDVAGLRTRSRTEQHEDGTWLRLDGGNGAGTEAGTLRLPVTEDGFQCVWRARLPLLLHRSYAGDAVRRLTAPDEIVRALRALADPQDRAGFDDFAEECRQTLATMRLHAETREETADALAARHGADPADWTGPAGGLGLDTLAARHDHPVYPTARGRSGLGEEQLRACAPEFHPRFPLRWLVLPRKALTLPAGAEALPDCWPTPAALGLPGPDGDGIALPVHPLSIGTPLRDALRATGLLDRAQLAEAGHLQTVPTLSMRTVAVADEPTLHLKLPLATATLGLRNRRTIKPATLADGAAGQRLLETVIAREPRFRDTVLLADETVYAHAEHELLAVLCRRYPAGLDGAVVVPMAALLAEAPGRGLVIDRLADRFHGGDPVALFDAVLGLLLDWQTTLFGYGIALESHQQNISLVLDRHQDGSTRVRLLLKDNDGPRLHTARLRAALGEDAPGRNTFRDQRILTEDDGPLTDLFTTITLHLCAGAYAFGLARAGRAPLERLLGLVRDRLAECAEALGTGPGEPGAVLRKRVLDAPGLPVKAMVSAGTLLTKARSGAADINKHYTSGPNYLLRTASTGGPR